MNHVSGRRFLPLILLFIVFCSTWRECAARQNSGTTDQEVVKPVKIGLQGGANSLGAMRTAAYAWVPPDVNESMPPVDPQATCSLSNVLDRAGRQLQQLADNLEHFRATETIQHQKVSRSGQLGRTETARFDYIVSLTTMPGGSLNVEEHRQGYRSSDQFPDDVETYDVPTLVFIFYPTYAKNFEMQCEGLGKWRGQPAWQIHFEQKDGTSPMSVLNIGEHSFALRLRGRAWILADSYQITRLETDLQQTIPKIRLRLQHEDIEYRPVYFHSGNINMWLPSSAELYMDFVGHRFYRRQSFTDFELFSITSHQVFGPPIADGPKQKKK